MTLRPSRQLHYALPALLLLLGLMAPDARADEAAEAKAGEDWWSLQPVVAPALPPVKDAAWATNPIDHFILHRLEQAKLGPSPPSDRRTLIRRVTFDLIGLPPTPAEVEAFLADDSPQAYEKLIDRLLASPRYGERWARHWLDVMRFGESHGFERDQLRPHAWRYRDWVINALNDDLPYDQFVRLQLAGDVLRPNDADAVIATGFLAAAPYDEVGHTQQSEPMRKVVRSDEMEEVVGTAAQTFLGLTVNCARCHDHKFDPISQVDYYRLSSALSGFRQGERDSLSEAGQANAAEQFAALDAEAEAASLQTRIRAIEAPIRERLLARGDSEASEPAPQPIARWDFETDLKDSIGSLHGEARGDARIENGRLVLDGKEGHVVTSPLAVKLEAKTLEAWVTLSSLEQAGGGVIGVQTLDGSVFDAIVYGERDARQWMAGSEFFNRHASFAGPPEDAAAERLVHVAIVYGADRSITAYRDGQAYGKSYQASAVQPFEAGKAQVTFGIRHTPPGGNKILAGAIEKAQLHDRALSAREIARSAGAQDETVTTDDLLAAMPAGDRAQWLELKEALSRLEMRRGLLSGGKTYGIVPQQPEIMRLEHRGQPAEPREVVAPAGIAAVKTALTEFHLAPDAPEAHRRVKLAEWITDPANPLTARVIANRLWHYHFGVGIVDTSNDFGFSGGRPSHPELLDWLASELIRSGWSVKSLHRTILLSSTYRQASLPRPEAMTIDADNRLLWRKSPMRLEAEAVRDSILSAAGQLNPIMGGPGFMEFSIRVHNSTFYDPIETAGFDFNRRSIYRTWLRSGRNHLLDVFDCPDPSTLAPRRVVTTTPLQALALMNNAFVLRMADALAKRLADEAGPGAGEQISLAYRLLMAREPEVEERAEANAFIAEHGMPAFCRVLLNSNEFLYVD